MAEEIDLRRPQFGNRYLLNEDDVFEHNAWKKPMHGSRYLVNKNRVFEFNAWDDVEWDEKQESEALKKVQANSVVKLSEDEINKYDNEANKISRIGFKSYW
ncbi:putative methyltransferase [Trypoxylus dichotomus]